MKTVSSWYRVTTNGSPLADVLRKTIKGRRYVRYKFIIRDEELTARLARPARDKVKLRRLLKRFKDMVLGVLAYA